MWLLLWVVAERANGPEDLRLDQLALGRAARGDADGLAHLYDRHARAVYSLALRILQDRADAEDVVQDVFAQAWRQAGRYEAGRGAVVAWLLTMTRSRAIDRLRARRQQHAAAPDRALDDVLADAPPPDLQLMSAEQIARVRQALDALPLVQRMALELAYYEGLTHAEIADRLEQPLGTIKTRIRLAMSKLRTALAEPV